jgi:hypothetical protein
MLYHPFPVPKNHTVKKYGQTKVELQEFLPSTLAEGQLHACPVTLSKEPVVSAGCKAG